MRLCPDIVDLCSLLQTQVFHLEAIIIHWFCCVEIEPLWVLSVYCTSEVHQPSPVVQGFHFSWTGTILLLLLLCWGWNLRPCTLEARTLFLSQFLSLVSSVLDDKFSYCQFKLMFPGTRSNIFTDVWCSVDLTHRSRIDGLYIIQYPTTRHNQLCQASIKEDCADVVLKTPGAENEWSPDFLLFNRTCPLSFSSFKGQIFETYWTLRFHFFQIRKVAHLFIFAHSSLFIF